MPVRRAVRLEPRGEAGAALDPDRFRSPAAFFVNGIGDHLMALPALRALAALMPGRLRLLCMPGAERLFFAELELAAVHHIHHLRAAVNPAAASRLAAEIGTCDLFLSFERHSNPSTLALVAALRPRQSVGHFPGFETQIPFETARHSTDLAFAIPAAFSPGLRAEAFVGPPRLPDSTAALVRGFRAQLAPAVTLLAVHADTKREKMWAPGKLAAVLGAFLDRHCDVVAVVIGAEKLVGDVGKHRGRVLSCCGIPLPASFGLVAACDLFLGVDSCMLHLADLCRVPGVGLFGPTDPAEYGFRFAPHRHIRAARMEDIAVPDVLDALESLWIK